MDQKPRPLHYFVPGQVVFHVTRSAGATDAQIIEQVRAQINAAPPNSDTASEF